MNIADELLKSSSVFGSRTAISAGEESLTYKHLFERSKSVAGYLQLKGIYNQCIAIEIQDVVSHITAMLGVVLSGNYYLSVNSENRCFISDDLNLAYTISTSLMEEMGSGEPQCSVTDIAKDTSLCAFFTSGSTGSAKMVVHQHKNIYADTMRQIRDNQITDADKIDLVFSLTFSASLACIFPALLTGAELCIFNLKEEGLNNLVNFWQQKEITFSTLSVSSFHGICKANPSLHKLEKLRFVSISAEPVKDDTIRLFQSTFNTGVVLQIAYSATETRTISEMKLINGGEAPQFQDAIGKAVKDKIIHIVNDDGNYLAAGCTGEIVVESAYIAHGYYGAFNNSESNFSVENDKVYYRTGDLGYLNNEGYLFYMGRLVHENKLNGVKINTALVEQLAEKGLGVNRASVVINKFKTDYPKLICFIEAIADAAINTSELKQLISKSLPASHVPQFCLQLPRLPVTHSGKIDRRQLESFDYTQYIETPASNAPIQSASNSERVVIDVFRDVLQDEHINKYSNFFAAGGDSMSSIICVAEIEKRLNISLSVTALLSNPTPKMLAGFIKQQDVEPSFIAMKELNEQDINKRNIYFLNHTQRNTYNLLYEGILSSKFNLIEIYYDIYGSKADHAQVVMSQLAAAISKHPGAIVLGYSFSGFVAHQLACLLPQIKYCIMIDTYNYFDYGLYKRPGKLTEKLNLIAWNFFNGDFKYALRCLINLVRGKALPKQLQAQKIVERINYFLPLLKSQVMINNCIYFQASRVFKHAGKTWREKVGGDFHYKSLRCNHGNILTHAPAIADFINDIVNYCDVRYANGHDSNIHEMVG